MNSSISNSVLRYAPIWFQNLSISLYGFYWYNRRHGKVFYNHLNQFSSRNNFGEEDWKKYQEKSLQELLVHAFKSVPFYYKKYSDAGFTLRDFENFHLTDLKELPFLEKEDLRIHGEGLLLSNNKSNGTFLSSSGSTGTPIKVFFSKEMHQKWMAAYEVRVRNWAGVNYKMRRGMIGGRRIIPNADASPPYFRYNFVEKQTYFSAYHLSSRTVQNYVDGLIKYKVDYLVGYAVSIFHWAEYILEFKINCPKMKAVLTSSEKLTEHMRNTIENAFKCKVFDAYSGVEACGLISDDTENKSKFSPDTGILEIINEQDNVISEGVGEVVLTGLLNFDQPLIRYRIGDHLKLDNIENGWPIVSEIIGRTEDVIVSIGGTKMVRFHSIFNKLKGVKLAQVIQKKLDAIEVKLVIDKDYVLAQEKEIQQRMESQLGKLNILFTYVNDIPKMPNGKFKSVVSEI